MQEPIVTNTENNSTTGNNPSEKANMGISTSVGKEKTTKEKVMYGHALAAIEQNSVKSLSSASTLQTQLNNGSKCENNH